MPWVQPVSLVVADFAIVACFRRLLEVDELPAPASAIAHLPHLVQI